MSFKYDKENGLSYSSQEYYCVHYITVAKYGRRVKQYYAKNSLLRYRSKLFNSERDAALEYDKKLISMGYNPVNILRKRKKV